MNQPATPPSPDAGTPPPAAGAPPAPSATPPGAGVPPNPAPWYPEAQKSFVQAKGWKDPADVLTSYANLESLIGADKAGRTVVLPKDESDVEGLKAYRAKLGIPESVDGYKVPDPLKADPFVQQVSQLALKCGIPAAAFEQFIAAAQQAGAETEKALNEKVAAATTEQLTKLKGEWGTEYTAREEFARRYMRESGWADGEVEAIERAVGTARMLSAFYKYGAATGEHKFVAPGAGGSNAVDVTGLQAQLNDIKAKYMAGQMSQADYFKQMEPLAQKIAAAA